MQEVYSNLRSADGKVAQKPEKPVSEEQTQDTNEER
jgi:hypothetical protein